MVWLSEKWRIEKKTDQINKKDDKYIGWDPLRRSDVEKSES